MPPLKTFTFVCLDNDNIKIEIKAYMLVEAFEILTCAVKHPADFKLVENI